MLHSLFSPRRWSLVALLVCLSACAPAAEPVDEPGSTSYEDLLTLFEEWRAFEAPGIVDGVPDYSAQAMSAQHEALAGYQQRLGRIDPSGWPVNQQVDYHIVRAEMNGLDFDHRVRRPWARNPAFYNMVFLDRSDVPAHEGPVIHGFIDVWTYSFPLSEADATELAGRFGTIPAVLEGARENLVEDCPGSLDGRYSRYAAPEQRAGWFGR